MFCAISGEIPQDPVVSKKTGHLYERRLIEKYIQEDGKCPISGESMDESDLVLVKANKAIRPRSVNATSIPGMLQLFQNEWDELTLETFTLKQHLDATRQELSQALYQHDAACRVIAKLMRERDEARSMLNALAAQGVSVSASASSSSSGAMEEAAEEAPTAGVGGLDAEVVDAIMSKCGELSKGRKGRKAPAGLLSRDLVGAFASGGDSSSTSSHTPHDSKSGITCLATPALSPNCDVVLTGGSDKKAIVSEVGSGKVVAKLLGHSKKVTCCALASGSLSALPVAVTGSADNTVKVWRSDGDSYQLGATYSEHTKDVTAVTLHPTERFMVSTSMDGSWCFLDMERASCLAQKSAEEDGPLTTARFHPDGLLLATGTSAGAVRIWDIREQKSAANCADHSGNGSVLCLGFSENGYLFASGASDGSAHIWDLRKLKSVQSIAAGNGSGITAVAFDLSGTYLAMGLASGEVVTTVVKEWTELSRNQLHSKEVTGLSWANNLASGLISSSLDRTIKTLSSTAQ